MERLPHDCSNDAILAFARRWTERLVSEDYAGAWAMLRHRPGEVWAPDPESLRARIVGYGGEPAPGEPVWRVTPIESAAGRPWLRMPYLKRVPAGAGRDRPDYRGRLDWVLPLCGAWSDLVASFDLVEDDGALALELASLRIP